MTSAAFSSLRSSSRRILRPMIKLILPCVAAVALVLQTACGKTEEAGAAADSARAAAILLSPQDLATAESRQIGAVITVAGSLDPAEMAQVRAQIAGTVTGVRVDRGSRVGRGAVLAVIEAQGIRSQAAGAEAQVTAAQAQVALARQQVEASKRLFEAGAISEIAYRTAQANVEAAEAQLAAARAQAAGARESAARATITAPISGVVSARIVNGGEAVSSGDDLFTIVDASELELAGQVGVQDAARVRVGQTVTFVLDAYPGQQFRGRVARIDPTADPGTRQVGIYARLPNPGNRMVGGQYARGRIETGVVTTATVVPEAAIANRASDSASVFVVSGGRAARRTVTLGARDDATGMIAVLTGVRPGERVLLNPTSDIGDGTPVSIVADKPAALARPDSTR